MHRVARDADPAGVGKAIGATTLTGVIADETNREHAVLVATALARKGAVRRMTVTRGVNGRGAKDLGVLPNVLPGYRAAPPGGKNGREILEAAAAGAIHALLIAGPNAALERAGELLDRALQRAESVIVVETRPGKVASAATVLIPGHAIFEKLGTVTNVEGRVQRVRPALPPAAQTPSDTRVLAALAAELGAKGWERSDPMSVNRALREAVPAYAEAGSGGRALWTAERVA